LTLRHDVYDLNISYELSVIKLGLLVVESMTLD